MHVPTLTEYSMVLAEGTLEGAARSGKPIIWLLEGSTPNRSPST